MQGVTTSNRMRKEKTYSVIFSDGPHDGSTLDDLYGKIQIPNYVETEIRDAHDRIIFRHEHGANLKL